MKKFRRSRSRGSHGTRNTIFKTRNHHKKRTTIDPRLFVKKAVDTKETPYSPRHTFTDFALDGVVQRNIVARGYREPTAIQDQAIKPILEGRDLVGIANTGTGKTAAFLLPLVTKVATDRSQCVLIVAPTRELAVQIQDELKRFSKSMGMYSVLCIGGASINVQIRDLYRNPNFIIGTPGRIKDLENRGELDLSQFGNVVLDEVDRMLDMGFIRDIKHIIARLPERRQSLFFSATLPKETKTIMQRFLTDPVTVTVTTGKTAQNVDQDVVKINGQNKLELLHSLLVKDEFQKVLVFGRTKWGIKKIEKNLNKRGLPVVAIHGNKSQGARLRALNMLKRNEAHILLATDVASRGLDIDDITHVINYDVPESYEDYVHRIGRTGRAGKKGIALTFIE